MYFFKRYSTKPLDKLFVDIGCICESTILNQQCYKYLIKGKKKIGTMHSPLPFELQILGVPVHKSLVFLKTNLCFFLAVFSYTSQFLSKLNKNSNIVVTIGI